MVCSGVVHCLVVPLLGLSVNELLQCGIMAAVDEGWVTSGDSLIGVHGLDDHSSFRSDEDKEEHLPKITPALRIVEV